MVMMKLSARVPTCKGKSIAVEQHGKLALNMKRPYDPEFYWRIIFFHFKKRFAVFPWESQHTSGDTVEKCGPTRGFFRP